MTGAMRHNGRRECAMPDLGRAVVMRGAAKTRQSDDPLAAVDVECPPVGEVGHGAFAPGGSPELCFEPLQALARRTVSGVRP